MRAVRARKVCLMLLFSICRCFVFFVPVQAVGERALASELRILAAEQATAERLALEQLQRRANERRANALASKAKELRAAMEVEANAALDAATSDAAAKLQGDLDALAASAAADEVEITFFVNRGSACGFVLLILGRID